MIKLLTVVLWLLGKYARTWALSGDDGMVESLIDSLFGLVDTGELDAETGVSGSDIDGIFSWLPFSLSNSSFFLSLSKFNLPLSSSTSCWSRKMTPHNYGNVKFENNLPHKKQLRSTGKQPKPFIKDIQPSYRMIVSTNSTNINETVP